MPFRRDSNCSIQSDSSVKSVRFQEAETIFFTHSPIDYDRAPESEAYQNKSTIDDIFVNEDGEDEVLLQNTNRNGRRNFQGMTVLLQIRSH
ncbi:hypothetical protein K501DRAFT_283991 [Backusella circina FSU 941]|nr:hypothetical protein K501DRAFT_283991 [Backusella circina FSU 941]